MSARDAWSYMCWLSGIMVGIGAVQQPTMLIGGAVLSLISFYALRRFGERS